MPPGQRLVAARAESLEQTLKLSNGGKVHVEVKSGHDLAVRDKSMFGKGSSDPYVQVWSGGFPGAAGCARGGRAAQVDASHEVGRTRVVPKSLNPVWEESNVFAWDMGPREKPVVVLALFDKDTLSKDDPMGMVTIPLSELSSGSAIDKQLPVEPCDGAADARGFLHVVATFDPLVPVDLHSGEPLPLQISHFTIGLGWDVISREKRPRSTSSSSSSSSSSGAKKKIDLDAAAVVFRNNGKLLEGVYFGAMASTRKCGVGALRHMGDSTDGEDSLGGDDELIRVDLSRFRPDVLAFFVCVCAFTDGTFFSDLAQSHCRVVTDDTDQCLAELRLRDLGPRTAVTMVMVHRDNCSSSSPNGKGTGGTTGWSLRSISTPDSAARNWGCLLPTMKNVLGHSGLVPGLRGSAQDRVAILSKGQSFRIGDTTDRKPDVWVMGLHWDVTGGKEIDLDASVLVLDGALQVLDVVFFNKLISRDRAIVHCGDEREGDEVGDDEKILLHLDRVDPRAAYLCLTINSYSGDELDDVKDAGCHLFDRSNHDEACRIDLSGDACFDQKTACFVCVLYRVNGGNDWWLKKVAEGLNGSMALDCVPGIQRILKGGEHGDLPVAAKEAELRWQAQAEAAYQAAEHKASGSIREGAALGGAAAGVGAVAVAESSTAAAAANKAANAAVGGNEWDAYLREVGGTDVARAGRDGVVAGANTAAAAAANAANALPVDPAAAVNAANTAAVNAANTAANAAVNAANALPVDPAAVHAAASELMESVAGATFAVDVDAALGAINGLAAVAEKIPCVGLIVVPMKEIVGMVREARYNKLATKNLADRIVELAAVLLDLLEAVPEPSPSLDVELKRLVPKLDQAKAFVASFSKRSYLGKLLSGHSDSEKLKLLDQALTDCVQNISVSVGVMGLAMQQRSFGKLEQLEGLVQMSRGGYGGGGGGGGADLMAPDSPVVAAISAAMGVEVREVASQLQFSIDQVLASQADIAAKLDAALTSFSASGGEPGGENNHWQGAPEDPKAFWSNYFHEKNVPIDLFVPVIEEEFLPGEDQELTPAEREAFVAVLDQYPHDGFVSIVEWKKFCRACHGKSVYGFIKSLLENKPAD